VLKNRVKAMVSAGQPAVGVFVGTIDPRFVEMCGPAGFDYVLLDAEHYPFTLREIENLVRAAELVSLPTFVRVAANRPEIIRQTLDVGVWGVMIPRVYSRDDAEAAVQAAKYAPLGNRGAQVSRVAGLGSTPLAFGEWAQISNDETMVIIQIETREAAESLSEILDVPGVDAFELGRLDLAQSLGFPGQGDHPTVRHYHDKAVKQILAAGRVLGDTTDDPAEAAAFLAKGYRMVACHLDRVALRATRAWVTGVRADL
jgi:4-hydroxy-2-oxoheptanedioate aldolase